MSTTEAVKMYRHSRNRKRTQFSDCDLDTPIFVAPDDAEDLGVHNATDMGVVTPFDEVSDALAHQMVFIIKVGEKLYLVNTEGYNYCRYITPCVIGTPSMREVTLTIVVRVVEGTRPDVWIDDAVSQNLETGEEVVSVTIVSDTLVEAK